MLEKTVLYSMDFSNFANSQAEGLWVCCSKFSFIELLLIVSVFYPLLL